MVQVVIVTPALAEANNGNWQTARRWQRFLAPVFPVRIVKQWPDAAAAGDGIMLALHARRSAQAIAAWSKRNGSAGLGVVLTGTDLYRDIQTDPKAQRSLSLANILVREADLKLNSFEEPTCASIRFPGSMTAWSASDC